MASNRKFTEEQMESLRGNQYILSVGEDMVFYTDEFKRLCWQMYTEERLMPKEIMRKLGVDYHVLGIPRVRALMYHLKKQHERDGDFSGDRGAERPKRSEKYTAEQQLERANAENKYLRQELEFVKKIIAAGGDVRR